MNKKIRKVGKNYIKDTTGRGMILAYPKRLREIW
jgi:hypothetical protein